MKKHLLATTAAIALIASPVAFSSAACAQDNAQSQSNNSVFNQDSEYKAEPQDGFFQADPNQILASRFIGATIYTGTGDNAESIGDVNDLIMTPDGRAVAVIAGIGGFLGLGEKEVAVSIGELGWQDDPDGDRVLVSGLTREQLEGAPKFDRNALTEGQKMASDQQAVEGENQQAAATDQEAVEGEDQQAAATDQKAVEGENQQAAATDQTAAENSGSQDEMTTSSTKPMESISAADARLEATDIVGMTVNSADGESIGEVSEILIGENGKVEAFVIDVGGFLGINEKPVAVSFDQLKFARAQGSEEWSVIQTGLTADQLKSQTAFNKDDYEGNKGEMTLEAPVAE